MSSGAVLIDTSIFVGIETSRISLAAIREYEGSVSIITSAELELGVHQAKNVTERTRRLRTLRWVDQSFDLLPVDRAVASAFSALAAQLKSQDRAVPIMDALIGATAIANGLKVLTQDRGFAKMPGVEPFLV